MYNIKLPEMWGNLWGRPPPTLFYRKVIEKAIAGYLYYLYGVLKGNQIFFKICKLKIEYIFLFFLKFQKFFINYKINQEMYSIFKMKKYEYSSVSITAMLI